MSLDSLTDPRLLAVQRATQNMAPEQAMQYIHKVADSGAVPGSLAYLMGLYQKVKALQGMQNPQQSMAQFAQPTVKDQMEAQLNQGIARLPAPTLERPDAFAGGGIVAFGDGGQPRVGPFSDGQIGLDFPASEYDELDPSYIYSIPDDEKRAQLLARLRKVDPIAADAIEMASRGRKITSESAGLEALYNSPEAQRLAQLRQEGIGQFDKDIATLDRDRSDAKAQMLINWGSQLASTPGSFLGSLASTAGPAVGEYAKSKRQLQAEERALRGEKNKAQVSDAQVGFDRLSKKREARLADETKGYAEVDRRNAALLSGAKMALDERQSQRQAAAQRSNRYDPWAVFGPRQEKLLAARDALMAQKGKIPENEFNARLAEINEQMRREQVDYGQALGAGISGGFRNTLEAERLIQASKKPGGLLHNLYLKREEAKQKNKGNLPPNVAAEFDAQEAQIVEAIRAGATDGLLPPGGAGIPPSLSRTAPPAVEHRGW